jgi:hypothetical protein
MMLPEEAYRRIPGPVIIVGDSNGEPVAHIELGMFTAMVEAMAVWTLSDSARCELVIPAWLRPAEGPGAVCPCGNDPHCAGCGGTGVFRGARDAVMVYAITVEGTETVAVTSEGCEPLTVVGGQIPDLFDMARKSRAEHGHMPLWKVLYGLSVTNEHLAVRRWK